jgi:aryl-alcohol dehydrogenase-like predicted oxidoreductase
MGGFLTGKYKKDKSPPRESRGEYSTRYWERIQRLDKYSFLKRISSVAEEVDIPIHKLAIAWILKNPTVTGAIVGASNLAQVEENCSLTEISNKVYQELNEATEPS